MPGPPNPLKTLLLLTLAGMSRITPCLASGTLKPVWNSRGTLGPGPAPAGNKQHLAFAAHTNLQLLAASNGRSIRAGNFPPRTDSAGWVSLLQPARTSRLALGNPRILSEERLFAAGDQARRFSGNSVRLAAKKASSGVVTRPLNKQVYQDADDCARKGWHSRKGLLPEDVKGLEAAMHLMQQGIEFEAAYVAHKYGDSALTIAVTRRGEEGLDRSAEETRIEMSRIEEENEVGAVLLQATLLHDGVVARADALEYAGGGEWDLVEVKSCSSSSYMGYLPDIAFTCAAALRFGVSLRRAVMVTVDTSGTGDSMFVEIDCTPELFVPEGLVAMLSGESAGSLSRVLAATDGIVPPEAEAMPQCKKCELFAECVGKGLTHPIWELPRLGEKKFASIASQSLEIAGISGEGLTAPQLRHWEAVQAKTWVVAYKALKKELSKLQVPYHYLDFESCSAIRPLFDGLRPFESVITQYSLHTTDSIDPSQQLKHTDYLARGGVDCRRELLEKLIEDLGEHGSIIIYSSYEKTHLHALAAMFPNLAPAVDDIVERLVDFEKVIKNHVSHPEFRGRSSLKVTLPVLVPEYKGRYAGMAVSNGAQASARFFALSHPGLDQEEEKRMRQELLDYCELDTLAMVELHRALARLAQGPGA